MNFFTNLSHSVACFSDGVNTCLQEPNRAASGLVCPIFYSRRTDEFGDVCSTGSYPTSHDLSKHVLKRGKQFAF